MASWSDITLCPNGFAKKFSNGVYLRRKDAIDNCQCGIKEEMHRVIKTPKEAK